MSIESVLRLLNSDVVRRLFEANVANEWIERRAVTLERRAEMPVDSKNIFTSEYVSAFAAAHPSFSAEISCRDSLLDGSGAVLRALRNGATAVEMYLSPEDV